MLALTALLCMLVFNPAPAASPDQSHVQEHSAAQTDQVLWYFWREDCPYCALAETWLRELQKVRPQLEVRKFEVARDLAGRERFVSMMQERGYQARSVPTFILGERVWEGFPPWLPSEIEAATAPDRQHDVSRAVSLGPLGDIDLEARSLLAATALIAFVDGFNPCSLWVLTFLLAMLLGTRSRARIAAVGLTFLLVSATVYGLFITGMFAAFVVAGQLGWIQLAVAALALLFGGVNVKDFFAFKRGLSLTIPDRFKPAIYRGGASLRRERPLILTLGITIGLAAGVAIVELPCTAGFPMLWTNLVSEAGVTHTDFAVLIAVYLLVYLSIEISIVAAAIITLQTTRMQEVHGRALKLFGGMVMIALGLAMIIDPGIMEDFAGSLLVIGAAVLLSIAVLVIERYRHPKA